MAVILAGPVGCGGAYIGGFVPVGVLVVGVDAGCGAGLAGVVALDVMPLGLGAAESSLAGSELFEVCGAACAFGSAVVIADLTSDFCLFADDCRGSDLTSSLPTKCIDVTRPVAITATAISPTRTPVLDSNAAAAARRVFIGFLQLSSYYKRVQYASMLYIYFITKQSKSQSKGICRAGVSSVASSVITSMLL